jgi:hypothetical protein
LDRLNQWLTLAANVGILVSILFLATQIEQNNQMMQVEALTTNTATHVQTDLVALGENPMQVFARYYAGATDFSDEELLIIGSWLSANAWQYRNSFRLYKLGIISEQDWESELRIMAGYLGTPMGVTYWSASKDFYDPEFVEAVGAALSERAAAGLSWSESLRNQSEPSLEIR